VIKHFFPKAFYNEGKVLYWTRAVIAGHFNDYLLPHSEYKDAVDYIIKTTGKDDPVFVWGDGPYLNYFSNRRIGGHDLWIKGTAYFIRDLYNKNDLNSLKKVKTAEAGIINYIDRKKPVLIIDVSKNGLSGFKVSLSEAKILNEYVKANYNYETEINGIEFYRIKK
jgi:hypothetical protein